MRQEFLKLADRFDADVVTFTPATDFPSDDAIFRIFPEVKTVIGLGFRILRGIFRGVEEGTVYYQYTTMGVENLEETVMPYALMRLSAFLEGEGYLAFPQRRHQLIMAEVDSTNPEVDYSDIFRGVTAETQMDFPAAAVRCGIGERGLGGRILNPAYGPFIRYCFILTDAAFEPTPKVDHHLCDNCGECMRACPGHAVAEDGTDPWQCAVYYSGAAGSKNPFMPPEAYADLPDRLSIIHGDARVDAESAPAILDRTFFYPPAKHFYRSSICGRACDRACYAHLEEKGVLTRSFRRKFREGADWTLDTDIFEK